MKKVGAVRRDREGAKRREGRKVGLCLRHHHPQLCPPALQNRIINCLNECRTRKMAKSFRLEAVRADLY